MHTDAEIDHLEGLLSNLEVMPDAMCVSELDGYVAGLLLCPQMIMPSEWLREVWGLDSEPEFASIEQAQATFGAVMAHYNRVAENLASRNKPYEIVLEQADGEGEPFWEFWIAGFEQAMRLRPEAWRTYFDADDTEVEAAFSCMCGLLEMHLGESSFPQDRQDKLCEHACKLIPEMVVRMNDWIKLQARIGMGSTPDWLNAANSNSGPARSNRWGGMKHAHAEVVANTSGVVGQTNFNFRSAYSRPIVERTKMKRTLLTAFVSFLLAGTATGHEAPQTPAEKAAYIENHLELFEVDARRIDTFSKENIPAIRYAIKNNGPETLTKVEVVVYFLDAEGLPFQEENYFPVLVTDSIMNDDKPLKPNYTYRMDQGRWMTVPNLGDEWGGGYRNQHR